MDFQKKGQRYCANSMSFKYSTGRVTQFLYNFFSLDSTWILVSLVWFYWSLSVLPLAFYAAAVANDQLTDTTTTSEPGPLALPVWWRNYVFSLSVLKSVLVPFITFSTSFYVLSQWEFLVQTSLNFSLSLQGRRTCFYDIVCSSGADLRSLFGRCVRPEFVVRSADTSGHGRRGPTARTLRLYRPQFAADCTQSTRSG